MMNYFEEFIKYVTAKILNDDSAVGQMRQNNQALELGMLTPMSRNTAIVQSQFDEYIIKDIIAELVSTDGITEVNRNIEAAFKDFLKRRNERAQDQEIKLDDDEEKELLATFLEEYSEPFVSSMSDYLGVYHRNFNRLVAMSADRFISDWRIDVMMTVDEERNRYFKIMIGCLLLAIMIFFVFLGVVSNARDTSSIAVSSVLGGLFLLCLGGAYASNRKRKNPTIPEPPAIPSYEDFCRQTPSDRHSRVYVLTQERRPRSSNYAVELENKTEDDEAFQSLQGMLNPDGMVALMKNAPVELPLVLGDLIASYIYPTYSLYSIHVVLADVLARSLADNDEDTENAGDVFIDMGLQASFEESDGAGIEKITFSRVAANSDKAIKSTSDLQESDKPETK